MSVNILAETKISQSETWYYAKVIIPCGARLWLENLLSEDNNIKLAILIFLVTQKASDSSLNFDDI